MTDGPEEMTCLKGCPAPGPGAAPPSQAQRPPPASLCRTGCWFLTLSDRALPGKEHRASHANLMPRRASISSPGESPPSPRRKTSEGGWCRSEVLCLLLWLGHLPPLGTCVCTRPAPPAVRVSHLILTTRSDGAAEESEAGDGG